MSRAPRAGAIARMVDADGRGRPRGARIVTGSETGVHRLIDRLLADALLLAHLGFVAFVVAGALLVARRPRLAWLHLPAATWGTFVEWSGTVCPLTPWEQRLRARAGQAGWEGGFVEHYLVPLLYPAGLSVDLRLVLGAAVVAINAAAYAWIGWRTWRRRRIWPIPPTRRQSGAPPPTPHDPPA